MKFVGFYYWDGGTNRLEFGKAVFKCLRMAEVKLQNTGLHANIARANQAIKMRFGM